MKRLFIALLIVLVAAVTLVAAIEYDPGYLLVSYGYYTFESSVWIGVLVFVLLFLLVYGFFSLLRRSIAGGSSLTRWLSSGASRRSQQQTTRGLINYIEGNWRAARRLLDRAAKKSDAPLIHYLTAARACHAMGDDKQLKEYLKKAEQSTSGASIAVGLTQAELQIASGRFEQALATLTRVRRNASKHPHVLFLLMQAYEGLNDWYELLALIPELKKYQVLNAEQLAALEQKTCRESILHTAKLKKDALAELHKLWQRLPKSAINDSDMVAFYAEHIMQAGDHHEAEALIRTQLKKDWNKNLIDLYGRVNSDDTAKQLMHAEIWLRERSNDAALLLCLGRLSLRNKLWGKAKSYFENSLSFENSNAACAELGRLLAQLGEYEKSSDYFQQSLSLSSQCLPELPQPDRQVKLS